MWHKHPPKEKRSKSSKVISIMWYNVKRQILNIMSRAIAPFIFFFIITIKRKMHRQINLSRKILSAQRKHMLRPNCAGVFMWHWLYFLHVERASPLEIFFLFYLCACILDDLKTHLNSNYFLNVFNVTRRWHIDENYEIFWRVYWQQHVA